MSFSRMAVSLGPGGGPADEGGRALQVRVAADAGADEELADLVAQARGVSDDGAEIDVVGHAVERREGPGVPIPNRIDTASVSCYL